MDYKKNYVEAYNYLEEFAKENNVSYYDIVEDSYCFEDGLMLIAYDDEKRTVELFHHCIDVMGNEIEYGGFWR